MSDLLRQALDFHRAGHLDEAEALYRQVLSADAKNADALSLLAALCADRGKLGEAAGLLQQAIEQDPAAPLFRYQLGGLLFHSGDWAAAIEAYHAAVERAPAFSEAWAALAECYLRTEYYPEALSAADRALADNPGLVVALCARGLALEALDRYEEAAASLWKADGFMPKMPLIIGMIGATLQKAGKLDEAERVFRAAIRAAKAEIADEETRFVEENEYAVEHWNLALLELLRGDYARGFAHYRARFKIKGRAQRPTLPQPLWRGEDLQGKLIFVAGEQGMGDVLMMARNLPLLRQQGAAVVLMAHPALHSLLAEARIADAIVAEPPIAQGSYAFQTSLFDLPLYFKSTPETLPPAAYLPLPPADAATQLPPKEGRKIGVVWAGKASYGDNRRRSIPLVAFRGLFEVPGCAFYSLMKERSTHEADILRLDGVEDLAAALPDFLATARFVAQMDLVITCDTAVAHLAGSMGKAVWVLLPFAPDWRWLLGRDDSPWYPSARLFRQERPGYWAGVIDRVKKALLSA